MNRKIHDTAMVNSSIALLQERFRQLQRVKEMREKRELLKMLSNAETKHFNFNSCMSHEPITTRLFFHPELININTSSRSSPPHVSLSLWPTTSQGMQDGINNNNTSTVVETPVLFKNLCSKDCTQKQPLQASWNNVYDSGVDTSLHL
ncbi:unnamed protein product [Trifolium pratense]|uniref:Uncharacterized protein n=1 Tax=Trifolium pratense TaxID=57577 RepID=A0ACB0K087_TRIPR|nr:unnamed protein product [Trifolium pratense]